MNRGVSIVAAGFALACAAGDGDTPSATVAPPPRSRMVSTTPGVSLEVVDWGGTGPALVFLAGLGNTAHVFDDFAPTFADRFHPIGITRRGFGASSASPAPASLDTLVADLHAVLDTLGLETVTLVGHSIAGEEMTQFAERFPDRCAALVYLDAAYDRTGAELNVGAQPTVPSPLVSRSDFASLATVRAFHQRVSGIREPDADLIATSRFDRTGAYQGETTADSLKARVANAVRVPRYETLRCPALALFAPPRSLADVVPYYRELDASGRAHGDSLFMFSAALVARAHALFERSGHRALDIPGNHYMFLEHPREVAAAMRAFLQHPAPPL